MSTISLNVFSSFNRTVCSLAINRAPVAFVSTFLGAIFDFLKLDIRAGARKDGTSLGAHADVISTEGEELVEIVRLEEASLLGVLQHPVGEELLEDLPVGTCTCR